MSTRTSFELHADGCRVVDVTVRPVGHWAGGVAGCTSAHVRHEHLPGRADQNGGEAGSHRGAQAAGPRTNRQARDRRLRHHSGVSGRRYQFLDCLPPRTRISTRSPHARPARRSRRSKSMARARASAIAVGPDVQVGTHRRREVSLVAVSEADVRASDPADHRRRFLRQPCGHAGHRADGRRQGSCNDLVPGSTMA